MTKQEEQFYYSDEMWQWMDLLQNTHTEIINDLRANFDSFTLTEQTAFQEIIKLSEGVIDNCAMYKHAYNKYHTKQVLNNVYVVKDGDTLVSIANEKYGNPTLWREIYEYNQLKDLDISSVKTLVIPKITVDDETDSIG